MKLKYDEPPSSFAIKFNLRRYTVAPALPSAREAAAVAAEAPLSVSADVERLVAAATCPDNLALMYEGWMPWL